MKRHGEDFDATLLGIATKYADEGRSVYVRLSAGQQLRVEPVGVPFAEPATEKQLAFISDLAYQKNVDAPDGPLSKAQASEVIDALQKGTYEPDKWTVPF